MRHFLYSALAACITSTASAAVVTVDFGNAESAFIPPGGISEDGFTFDLVSGNSFGTANQGNGGSSFAVGLGFFPTVGDSVTLTSDAGDLFTLNSFDFGSGFDNGSSDTISLAGFLNGVLVDSVNVQGGTSFQTNSNGLSGNLDLITFTVNAVGFSTLLIDNLVLETTSISTVPLPLSALLLGTSVLGLTLTARRKS